MSNSADCVGSDKSAQTPDTGYQGDTGAGRGSRQEFVRKGPERPER